MKARSRAPRRRDEAGVSTVEVVFIAPIMIGFVLLLVGLGIYADDVGKVQSAAQDAARMGSLQRGLTNEQTFARNVAWADLSGTCNRDDKQTMGLTVKAVTTTGGTGTSSQVLQVTVTCHINLFTTSFSVAASAYAPINYYSGQTS